MKSIQSKAGLLAAGIVMIVALTLAYVSGGSSTPLQTEVSETAVSAVSVPSGMQSSGEFSAKLSDNMSENTLSSASSEKTLQHSATASSSQQQLSPSESAVSSHTEGTTSSSVSVSSVSSAVASVVPSSSAAPTVIRTETSVSQQTAAESSVPDESIIEDSIAMASTAQTQTEESLICHATLLIDCSTALQNDKLSKSKKEILPADGNVFAAAAVEFTEGTTVFELLKRICADRRIHMDFQTIPVTGGAYIRGICNLYEYDCGPVSGWMYRVNGEFPNVGCSDYKLSDGDEVAFLYSCDLGADIGNVYTGG